MVYRIGPSWSCRPTTVSSCARACAHTHAHTHTRARAHARTPHALLLGFVYIFDPESGCADKLDVGENAYAMVLADDVTGYPPSARVRSNYVERGPSGSADSRSISVPVFRHKDA